MSSRYSYKDCLTGSKSQNLKRTLLHPDNELFAFHWKELPSNVERKVEQFIRNRYGYDITENEIKHIFKCSVARNASIKMPYIKVETVKIPKSTTRRLVFNESTFEYDSVDQEVSPETTQTNLYLYVYAPNKPTACYRDNDGYVRLGFNVNFFASFNDIGKYNETQMSSVEAECIALARQEILEYIRGSMSNAAFAATIDEINAELYKFDWTKKNVFHFKKSYFMQFPPNFENDYEWDNDDELLDTIKKYGLPYDECKDFIDWLTGNCEKPINVGPLIQLTSSTAHLFKNNVDWGWLGRGNIVDNYHGIPNGKIHNLEVGSTFTTKTAKSTNTYVVVRVGYDEGTKLIAYAKEGTTMNSNGFMDFDDIYLGISSDVIEDSWDALYDVNRVGRRKKILKGFTIVV